MHSPVLWLRSRQEAFFIAFGHVNPKGNYYNYYYTNDAISTDVTLSSVIQIMLWFDSFYVRLCTMTAIFPDDHPSKY